MTPSINAMFRWREHFPELSLSAEFARARPAGHSTKKQIRRQCPVRFKAQFNQRGVYYLRAHCQPADAIFVVAPGEFIVDVFPLGDRPTKRGEA